MVEDIEKCCRICLDVENNHVSILGDPTIHLHLKSCLGMSVSTNDCLPKVICSSCVNQLNDFYNFQLNARCSQDWLETTMQEKAKKCSETKTPIQPLPDSEYNSDSLLEFLNNTANIEEYLNNLGKEDIPSIVNLLDRNETSIPKTTKVPTPKKKDSPTKATTDMNMEIDVLESDIIIVKEIVVKKSELKPKINQTNQKIQHEKDKNHLACFACEATFDTMHKLTQHMSICDQASRTCNQCKIMFDSKLKMQKHYLIHNASCTCFCGKQFQNRDYLIKHYKTCIVDHGAAMGCSYRCKECGETFNERFQLYRHAKEHVFKSEERICDICGHSFIGTEALSKHKEKEHKKPNNLLYRCKICSFTSNDHKETYMHVKGHTQITKIKSTRHLCESCGRSFTTPASLLRHSQQHEKKKEYVCKICSKQFSDEMMRDEHVLEHSKVIMCERCGQTVNCYSIDAHRCI